MEDSIQTLTNIDNYSERQDTAHDLRTKCRPSCICSSISPTGSSHSDEVVYERVRLQSLPLPEVGERLIPRAHSNRKSSISVMTQSKYEEGGAGGFPSPSTLSFKRRRYNEEGPEVRETGSRLDSVYGDRRMRNYSFTKSSLVDSSSTVEQKSSGSSILHYLLTKENDCEWETKESKTADEILTSSTTTTTTTTNDNIFIAPTTTTTIQLSDVITSGASQPRRFSEAAVALVASRCSSLRLNANQPVLISKSAESSVNRMVGQWLGEIAQLAARYGELISLPSEDWAVLVGDAAASRLLLLFMAESNFQFAVTPVPSRERRRRRSADGREEEEEEELEEEERLVPVEIPTVQSVEDIRRFIAKCQAMKLDKKEYHCVRLITLFHSGCRQRLEKPEVVEEVNSAVRKILQRLVLSSHPDEKLRYGELLLHLNSLLRINGRMIEALFCKEIETRAHLRNFIHKMM